MLRIGFTTQYYTLWDVTTEVQYSVASQGSNGDVKYYPYAVTTYQYLQNLSKDLVKAQEKASSMGCVSLEADKELFGRNSSWETTKKLWCDLPKNQSPFFEYGKYRDSKIIDCTDLNYLYWYFGETDNIYAKQLLISSGTYRMYDSVLYSVDRYNEIIAKAESVDKTKKFYNVVKESDYAHVVIRPTKNISGQYNLLTATTSDDVDVDIMFKETREMFYNGWTYKLPVVNGVGKKIKNKELVLLVKATYLDDIQSEVLEVVSIKSIK
jgi:hypothetical protein